MDLGTRRNRAPTFIAPGCRTILEWWLVSVLFVFVLLGLLSLPLSILWQTEDSKNQSMSISLDNQSLLTVDYPAMLLLEDKPAQLSVSLLSDQATQPLTQPLTITVQLPRALLLAAPPQTYRDAEPTLVFQPLVSRVQTQTLQIANARLVDGLEQTQTITLTTINSKPAVLPIRIEGTLRAALRGFLGNSLIPLITAFLSAAGLFFTLLEKRREAEEKKVAERREQASKAKGRFRELMCQQNAGLAKETLQELEKQSLAELIDSADRSLMRRLIDWSEGGLAELNIDTLPPDWLNATAGALVFAFNNGQGKTSELLTILRRLPTDKLSENVRSAVQAAINLPEQARHWPIPSAQPEWELITLGEQWKGRLATNPFPFDYAEDDIPLLFSQVGAFWGEHPLYKRIKITHKTEIIQGKAGTGKTAMALALGEYLHDPETLACNLSGLPEERDIQFALTKRLLDFVCYHPTFLRKLGQDSRTLLARVCTDALDRPVVLAALDSAPIEKMEYITQAKEEREKREHIVRSQLRLFRDTIVSLPAREYFSFHEWSDALVQCARSLDFKIPVRIVIDASGEHCPEWINLVILPRLAQWKMRGIVAAIFVPDRTVDTKLSGNTSPWLGLSQLEWDSALLAQMLDHRFKSIMAAKDSRVVRSDIADDDLWNPMIEKASNNPRCFIRLWNRMLSLATQSVLDKSVLEKALEGFECP